MRTSLWNYIQSFELFEFFGCFAAVLSVDDSNYFIASKWTRHAISIQLDGRAVHKVNTEMSLKKIWFQQITKWWHHKSTKPRNHRITEPWNQRIMEPQKHGITKSLNHDTDATESQNHRSMESPKRLNYKMNLNYIVLKQNKHYMKTPEFKYRIWCINIKSER